jgi:hypothetical protein
MDKPSLPFLREELSRFLSSEKLSTWIDALAPDTVTTSQVFSADFQGMACSGRAFTAYADADNYLTCLVFGPVEEEGKGQETSRSFTEIFPDLQKTREAEILGYTHSNLHLSHLGISDLQWVYPIIYCDSETEMQVLWNKLFFQTDLQQLIYPLLPTGLQGSDALDFLLNLPYPGETIEFVDGVGFGVPCFFGKLGPQVLSFLQSQDNFLSEIGEIVTLDAYGSVYTPYVNYFNLRVPLVEVNCDTPVLDRIDLAVELISPTFYLTEDAEIQLEGSIKFKQPDLLLTARGRWWPQKDRFGLRTSCRLQELPFFQLEDLPGLEARSAELEVGAEIVFNKADLLVHSLQFDLELDYWVLFPGILELEHLAFDVEIYQPESLRLVLANFQAALVIGPNRLRFLCEGHHPDGLLDCRLDPATPIYIHELMHGLTGLDLGIPDHLRISHLNGSYNYQTKRMRFQLEVSSSQGAIWELHGFQLRDLRFEINGTMPDVSVSVEANLGLESNGKTVDIPVLVRYQGKDRGWLFEGSVSQADQQNPLTLTDFVQGISGDSLPMPSSKPIVIDRLHAAFYSKSKALAFDASASKLHLPVPGFDGIDLEDLSLEIRKADDLHFHFGATTRFDNLDFAFTVGADYGPLEGKDEKGWHLRGNSTGDLQIQDLLNWMTGKFNTGSIELPDSLSKLAWSDIHFDLQKGSQSQLSFGAKASGFKLSEKLQGEIELGIELNQKNGSFDTQFTGLLTVVNEQQPELPHRFQFYFGKSENTYLALTYLGKVTFHDLVGFLAPDPAPDIPNWINPSMEESVILWKPGDKAKGEASNLLFGVKINMTGDEGLDLSQLEFVGKFIPADQSTLALSVDLMLAQKPIEDTSDLNSLLSDLSVDIKLPDEISGLSIDATVQGPFLGAGKSGPENEMKIGLVQQSTESKASDAGSAPGEGSKTQWKEVSKKLGPVKIRKIGFTVEDGKAKLLLDAGMEMGGFAFELLGFGLKVPIRPNLDILREVEFGLEGMELDVKRDSFTIAGGFRRQVIYVSNKPYAGYAGELRLTIGDKSITAFGGYVDLDGIPSFFLYAVALVPLGGPPEFFLEGFAGGIGINSSLNIPPIEGVRNFIMVKAAFGESYFEGEDTGSNLSRAFQDIPPKVGNHWVAIGIKASHYKFIESFMLAAISVGDRVEIQLLGLARLKMPKGAEKLAKAELAIHAQIIPEEGVFCVDARITDGSYILNPMAKLSGGFAFYTWFAGEHAGDFVITLGGYAPKFRKPEHYPSVPRLALSYQVTESIFIKGSAYFALNPRMLMAGGRLEGNVDMGWIQAWFKVEAHFLMNFQPYQYFISASIRVGATFTVDLWLVTIRKTVQLGADLELWGPEFGGYALVDLAVTDFKIEFGKNRPVPLPISWETFKKELLPPEEDINRISLPSGVVKELQAESYGPDSPRFIVDPTDLEITVATNIPAKKAALTYLDHTSDDSIFDHEWPLGVGPMGISKEAYQPKLTITFSKEGSQDATGNFQEKKDALWKRAAAPAALWGSFLDRNVSAPPLLGKGRGEALPFTGASFRPVKDDSGEVLPDMDMKKVLAPQPDSLQILPQSFTPIKQGLNAARLSGKTSMLEVIKTPQKGILDQLQGIEDFSHLPIGRLTFDPKTITQEDIDQFEDEPLLGSLGARDFIISNLQYLSTITY